MANPVIIRLPQDHLDPDQSARLLASIADDSAQEWMKQWEKIAQTTRSQKIRSRCLRIQAQACAKHNSKDVAGRILLWCSKNNIPHTQILGDPHGQAGRPNRAKDAIPVFIAVQSSNFDVASLLIDRSNTDQSRFVNFQALYLIVIFKHAGPAACAVANDLARWSDVRHNQSELLYLSFRHDDGNMQNILWDYSDPVALMNRISLAVQAKFNQYKNYQHPSVLEKVKILDKIWSRWVGSTHPLACEKMEPIVECHLHCADRDHSGVCTPHYRAIQSKISMLDAMSGSVRQVVVRRKI